MKALIKLILLVYKNTTNFKLKTLSIEVVRIVWDLVKIWILLFRKIKKLRINIDFYHNFMLDFFYKHLYI
jgi:hypothetical protein